MTFVHRYLRRRRRLAYLKLATEMVESKYPDDLFRVALEIEDFIHNFND